MGKIKKNSGKFLENGLFGEKVKKNSGKKFWEVQILISCLK